MKYLEKILLIKLEYFYNWIVLVLEMLKCEKNMFIRVNILFIRY